MNLRRFGLALVIAAAGMVLLWLYVRGQQARRAQPAAPAPAVARPAPAAARQAPASRPAHQAPAGDRWHVPIPPSQPEKVLLGWIDGAPADPLDDLAGGCPFQVELVPEGAAVQTVKLADYYVTIRDKQLAQKDPAEYERARKNDPRKYPGRYSLLNPVGQTVSGLNVTTPRRKDPAKGYAVRPDGLYPGADQYGDQAGTFTAVPGRYAGLTLIQTAAADRLSTGAALLRFTLDQDAPVYILHDDAIAAKPNWLTAGFTNTGDKIVSTAGTFSVYHAALSAGTVTLGGNTVDGQGEGAMYTVVAGVRQRLPLATRRLVVLGPAPGSRESIALDRCRWHYLGKTRPKDQPAAESAAFELILRYGADFEHGRPALKLTKVYTVRKDSYSVEVSLRVENLLDDQPLTVGIDQAGPIGVPREDIRTDMREAPYGWLSSSDGKVEVQIKSVKELKDFALGRPVDLGSSEDSRPRLWVGLTNKFFGSMMYLRPEPGEGAKDRLDAPKLRARFYVAALAESAESRAFATGLRVGLATDKSGSGEVEMPLLELAPGKSRTAVLDVFAGPKKRDLFTSADARGHRKLYKDLSYLSTINLRGCICALEPLTLAMMWLLQFFSRIPPRNYGLAIILLVVLVRIALHPLTKRSQVSMSRMQRLKPQIDKLKEKYAHDKQTLNRELMKLQGPAMLGCLPMFLQLPILVALYTGLSATVELRHAAFLPVWITDLAGPDALVAWDKPVHVPVIGAVTGLNLLPILLTVATFLQTKLTPQSSQAAASPDQAAQQKMMNYMMPVMMMLFFYNAPSGLNLYFMTSTFAGVAEAYLIRRHIRRKDAAEAARETTVEAPGKAPRASRPKKPRGPFWIKRG